MAVDKDEIIAQLVQVLVVVVNQLQPTEEKLVAIGQDILDHITGLDTAVDSIIALLNSLVPNVIPQAVADRINAAIESDRARIEAAVLANTPPPPPPSS